MTALTPANQLTLLRMLLIPPFAILLLYEHRGWALAVFLTAGLTDLFDGLIARKTGQKTTLGAWLDPMADKLLLVTMFVMLTLPGIGFADRQGHHQRRDPVAEVAALVLAADAHRNQRDDLVRHPLAATAEGTAEHAGGDRQDHVVHGRAAVAASGFERAELGAGEGDAPVASDLAVQKRLRCLRAACR